MIGYIRYSHWIVWSQLWKLKIEEEGGPEPGPCPPHSSRSLNTAALCGTVSAYPLERTIDLDGGHWHKVSTFKKDTRLYIDYFLVLYV